MITLRNLQPDDYDYVIERVDDWWGGRPMQALLSKLFFVHFTETSLVAIGDDQLAGFLCGFLSQSRPDEAYIHFVGVDPDFRAGRCRSRALRTVLRLGARRGTQPHRVCHLTGQRTFDRVPRSHGFLRRDGRRLRRARRIEGRVRTPSSERLAGGQVGEVGLDAVEQPLRGCGRSGRGRAGASRSAPTPRSSPYSSASAASCG